MSIAGVDVTPISGVTWEQPRSSDVVSFAPSKDTRQSCVPVSASKANALSCSVDTNSTLWIPPEIVTDGTYSGCASTLPSTPITNSF